MAQIKKIYKGESLTLVFNFSESYNMSRLKKHEVYIGTKAFKGTISGNTITVKLQSIQTDAMVGVQHVTLWLDDTILGVRKPYVGDLVVTTTNAHPDNESTSEADDIIIPVVISETTITVGDK